MLKGTWEKMTTRIGYNNILPYFHCGALIFPLLVADVLKRDGSKARGDTDQFAYNAWHKITATPLADIIDAERTNHDVDSKFYLKIFLCPLKDRRTM